MSENQDIEAENNDIQTIATDNEVVVDAAQSDNVTEDAATIEGAEVENTTDANSSEGEKANNKDELILCANGEINWNGLAIARLLRFESIFAPKFELIGEELNREETAQIVTNRLDTWFQEQIRSELYPLFKLKSAIDFVAPIEAAPLTENTENLANSEEIVTEGETAEEAPKPTNAKTELSAVAKAFAQKILDAGGVLERNEIEADIGALSQDHRRELRRNGVKFGRSAIYLPLLLKPKSAAFNAILHHFMALDSGEVFVPKMGVTSFDAPEGIADEAYRLLGFKNVAGRVIRLDILDRVQDSLFEALKEAKGAISLPLSVVSLLGVSNENAQKVVEGLGWEKNTDEEGNVKWSLKRVRPKFNKPVEGNAKPFAKKFEGSKRPQKPEFSGKKRKDKGPMPKRNFDYVSKESKNDSDSPFAILAKLKSEMGK